jgi:hypothetical protein
MGLDISIVTLESIRDVIKHVILCMGCSISLNLFRFVFQEPCTRVKNKKATILMACFSDSPPL